MADGSIHISTKLDTDDAKKGFDGLKKEAQKAADSVAAAADKINGVFTGMSESKLTSAFASINKELEKTKSALREVDSQLAEIRAYTDRELTKAATDEQAKNLLDMEALEAKDLIAEREKLAEQLARQQAVLKQITDEMERQAEIAKQQAAASKAGTELRQAVKDEDYLVSIRTEDQYSAELETVSNRMAMIEQQAERIAQKSGLPKGELLEQNAEYQKLFQQQQLLIGNAERYRGKISQTKSEMKLLGAAGKSAGDKTKKAMNSGGKSLDRVGASVKNAVKKMGKMALACLGVEAIFSAIRKAANAYMDSNEQLSQQMTAIWNVAGQALSPIIDALVNGISVVITYVNSLIKSLTGVDLIARANAAALKKQASATKEAAKAAQLAGFDEMTKLSDNSSSSNSDAAVFTAPEIEMTDFFVSLKDRLTEGNFYGAGTEIAQQINEEVENFDWATLGFKIAKFLGDALAVALAVLLHLDPTVVFEAASELLEGLFNGLSAAIGKIDWWDVGKQLVKRLMQGIALSNPGAALWALFLNPNGSDLVASITKLVGEICGALVGALAGAGQYIWEGLVSLWNSIVGWFSDDENTDWGDTPEEILQGLWDGICEGCKNVGEWCYNNIWVPFRDGFCDAFGIASPSKEMKTLGGYVTDGLFEGIGNIWEKVSEKFTAFKTSVTNWFTDKKEDFKEWGSGVISRFGSGIGNIWEKIKTKFTDAKTKIGNWGASLKEKASAAGSTFVDGLKSGLDTLTTKLKEPINGLIEMMENAINWIIGQLNKLSFDVPEWVKGIGGKTFGFNIPTVTIPRLARGGIVNNPGRGVPVIAGEAGREAVLPLENNTEWMDILADKINAGGGNVTLQVILSGRKIYEEIVNLANKRNFATNGAG